MRQGAKPTRAKVEAEPAGRSKSPKAEASRRRELEKRLAEALEQQTATSEILGVISSSPTDVQPVFDAISRRAATLCEATNSGVFRFTDGLIHLAAHHNWTAEELDAVRRVFPAPPGRGSVTARAILTRTVAHVIDLAVDPEYAATAIAQAGFRTVLSVPMLQEGQPIGAITVARMEARPFSDRQIALLRTFAAQAVIAVENVRLFADLDTRNTELRATLEQQTATSEVLKLISRSTFDLQPVLETLLQNATRLAGAEGGLIARFEGEVFRFVAEYGTSPEFAEYWRQNVIRPGRGGAIARAALERRTVHIADVLADPEFEVYEAQRVGAYRSVLGVPMLKQDELIGVFFMYRTEVRPFSDKQIALVTTFADQAGIAIENARLLGELQAKNADLTESLERQTATSEILRVISSSPTDVQPVLEAVVDSATRLCHGPNASIFLVDGDLLRLAATRGYAGRLRTIGDGRLISRDWVTGRAVVGRTTVHIHDLAAAEAEFPQGAADARRTGHRTTLATPLLREGVPIGAILIRRMEVRPFTDKEIDLLKTFADQAVIAIENVRLFKEVQARNGALTESLEQQTATSEILRVISSSPTDIQPVFDIIGERAEKLCDAATSLVTRFDGELLHLVSIHGVAPEGVEAVRNAFPMRPDAETVSARAVRTCAVVHVADVLADTRYEQKGAARASGYRACLGAPMVRDNQVVGVIFVARTVPGLFTDTQVELLKTFAEQAVIAIENVRLFKELEARNSELRTSLEQQTATSELLKVIGRSTFDLQPVFETLAESAVRLCGAERGIIFRFDGQRLNLVATHNISLELRAFVERNPIAPGRHSAAARAALERRTIHIHDVTQDPEYTYGAAQVNPHRTILGVPMLRAGELLGVVLIYRHEVRPFSDGQIALMETFADQAAIAIENARLLTEVQARNRELTEALEQQTATSEVLKVISRSTFDLEPVLQTLIENAARLCGAEGGVIYKSDGQLQRLAAAYNISPEFRDFVEQNPLGPGPGTAVGRAMLEARTIHIHDVLQDPNYTYGGARLGGYRTILGVPMLREGMPIGVFAVWRYRVHPFTDKQIELVTTFADQGAIAIENVRLFQELEARTRELTRSVGELQALGEVSQAVSSTLDLDAVLATIVSRAVQLSGSDEGVVYEFDEATQTFHQRATHKITPEHVEAVRAAPIRLGEGVMGRAGVIRQPVQVADIEDDRRLVAPQVRDLLAREGMRSLLAVPFVREDRLLGGLVILRRERGAFSPEIVATLQTFATQSVLAIHNARLFREIQRQKQYSEALVETSPVAIVTLDLSFAVVGWNPGAERLFGYT